MKVREKPVPPIIFEAEQYLPEEGKFPAGMSNRPGKICGCVLVGGEGSRPHIHTFDGIFLLSPGDWVLVGPEGERRLCKPEEFTANYEIG